MPSLVEGVGTTARWASEGSGGMPPRVPARRAVAGERDAGEGKVKGSSYMLGQENE